MLKNKDENSHKKIYLNKSIYNYNWAGLMGHYVGEIFKVNINPNRHICLSPVPAQVKMNMVIHGKWSAIRCYN